MTIPSLHSPIRVGQGGARDTGGVVDEGWEGMSVGAGTRRGPKARSEGLVVQALGEELLIYDLDTDQAHCLGPTAASVWKRCDGDRTVAQITDGLPPDAGSSEEVVRRAISELAELGLLDAQESGMDWSRRELVLRVGGAGAAAAASAPLVKSIIAPTPAAAVTCRGATQTCGGVALPCCPGLLCCASGAFSGTCRLASGASCTTNSQCCSNRCLGNNTCQ